MKALVVLPDLQRVGQHRRGAAPAPEPAAHEVDVLVVDDGSPDGTADLAEALAAELGGVEVLRRPGKGGLGAAYREGFRLRPGAGYDVAHRDGRRPLARPGRPRPTSWPRSTTAPTSPSARATCRAGRSPTGPGTGGSSRGPATSTPAPCSASRSGTPRRASGPTTAAPLEMIDLTDVRADGYGFQVEMAYRSCGPAASGRGADLASATAGWARSKMSGRIVVEALILVTWWGCPPPPARGSGGRPPGSERTEGPRRRRPAHHPPRRPRRLLRLGRGARGPDPQRQARPGRRDRPPGSGGRRLLRVPPVRRPLGHADGSRPPPLPAGDRPPAPVRRSTPTRAGPSTRSSPPSRR